jgi:hypothetical protein
MVLASLAPDEAVGTVGETGRFQWGSEPKAAQAFLTASSAGARWLSYRALKSAIACFPRMGLNAANKTTLGAQLIHHSLGFHVSQSLPAGATAALPR